MIRWEGVGFVAVVGVKMKYGRAWCVVGIRTGGFV
jgi:hypothetical protein